jgi:hypothetical protein
MDNKVMLADLILSVHGFLQPALLGVGGDGLERGLLALAQRCLQVPATISQLSRVDTYGTLLPKIRFYSHRHHTVN